MPDLIGKTLGGYRIIEQIGLGGMATVFKAYQPSMDRYVAFKVISTHLAQDPTFVKRFQQEAKVIAKLEHLHILPVYDYGEEDGYLYLVMRFIEAGTLKDRLEGGPLSLGEARHVVSQVGSALEYTHQLGVVHRDLKPSNVLIDPQGDCYLTDFGLAKMVEGTLGLTGSGVLGTPHYMAPEQSQSLKVDHRADVYAMGVIIYEMVTGQVPFDAETPFSIVLKHISEPLPLPRSIKSDLPEGVERVILKALAKDPADRYQSMRDLVTAFDQAVGVAPAETHEEAETPPTAVVPGPAPVLARRRWVTTKRPWLLVAAALALLSSVLVVLVLAGVILSRVKISGGQVQVGLVGTATPAFTQPPPALPTATPILPTKTPSPTVMAPLTVSATDTSQPTLRPVPPSPTAIPPSTLEVTQLALLDTDWVRQLAWSPDGSLLAVATYHIYFYDAQALEQIYVIDAIQWTNSIAFSPDGTMLASASHDGVKLWEVGGWGEIRTLTGSQDTESVAFSPDGRMLATATGSTVKLWDVVSGNELRTLPAGPVRTVAFSPDGRTLAAGAGVAGQEIKLWDVESGNELHTLTGHSNWINVVVFSPDGQTLASGSVDSTIRLWDVATGRQLRALSGHTDQVESVAFSPDGRLLASASWDLTVKLWNVASGDELRSLTGHTGWVMSVAFSPDGAILASGANDSAVRLWDLAP